MEQCLWCVVASLLLNILYTAVISVIYTRFKADKDIIDALVHTRKQKRAGGRGEATDGEPALATSRLGICYDGDAGVVSQSPEQLREMMSMVTVVCVAIGLTVSEVKAEIMCFRTKDVPETAAIFIVEAAGQVYNQTNEFVHLGGISTKLTICLSRSTGAYKMHGAASGNTSSN